MKKIMVVVLFIFLVGCTPECPEPQTIYQKVEVIKEVEVEVEKIVEVEVERF